MLCDEASLVNEDGHGGQVNPLRCKRWNCPICFPFKCDTVKRDVIAGAPTKFLTLTSVLDSTETPDEAARDMVKAWFNIRRRMKIELGIQKLEFIAIFEQTKKGWPHLHIALRSKSIPQGWISDKLAHYTGATQAKIKAITYVKGVGHYLAKYLSKCPIRYKGCKRYWRSMNWKLPESEADQRPKVFQGPPIRVNEYRGTIAARIAANGTAVRQDRMTYWFGGYAILDPPAKPRASGAQLWSTKSTAEPPPLCREAA